jgi:tRNA pseudouridine55 synthase
MGRQRKRKGEAVHGWLNIDKPADITSTQVVSRLKRLYNAQKVGHGGTLDPLATGVLPIAFGEATKTVQWAMEAQKTYRFTIAWGCSTESQDREGDVTARSDARPDRDAIEAALKAYVGEIEQVPPKFSAIKVDGARAYDLARDGETFALESRTVTVHAANVVSMTSADETEIEVQCGKGFYVRALARDLACDLDCDGHISALRRTCVGVFDAESANPLAKLEEMRDKAGLQAALDPLETALDDIPVLALGQDEVGLLKQGRTIRLLPHIVEQWRADKSSDPDDRLALAMSGRWAVALGEVRAGRFSPTRVFQV